MGDAREIQTPGGVARVREQLERARKRDAAAQLFPEVAVSIVGNDHLRANEPAAAAEIAELNLLAYPRFGGCPHRPGGRLPGERKVDLARKHAETALPLLDSRAAPASSWSDTEPPARCHPGGRPANPGKASRSLAGWSAAPPRPTRASPRPPPSPTLSAALDREIRRVEEQVIAAAEAMPEDRFDFSPEQLRIPGAAYHGVRSFAVQVKHVATSNYFLWSPLAGERLPEGLKDGEGPPGMRSKAEILGFLRQSFALGHRAAATLTPENMLQPAGRDSTRLQRATFAVAHAFDHYGQMVEYLRMNGIVPPASRPQVR